ncbi:izumo sperm-egg fusion protein 3 isoform X2 [Panthera uncia]|uniref:izumo sperm-egg fusion protein 3 isoform X3 n=1 Tax=Panthera leo TaxID=9689 RepID=UPI001C69A02F|nr:izumo sperm-egg fusion protein 3 isoform X3 [Panthera leo]XP_049492998.1 izumo sperm-egg fusion protein 3 isoform X2 [Panthera uncia]
MGDLWLLLLLPLSLAAFHGVKACLECDPKFKEDIRSLITKLVPSEVPGRTHLLEWQIKEMIHLSFKVSHGDKMLRVLAVHKAVKLRIWLKNELYKLGNETWKACSEDCVVTEGPILDCWTCLRITTQCFRGEYCGEEDSRTAENREIGLFLILLTEVVILGSAWLLFHICVSHWRKMKAIRRSLKKYLEKKLEELIGMTD